MFDSGQGFDLWHSLSFREQNDLLTLEWFNIESGFSVSDKTISYSFLEADDNRAFLDYVPENQELIFEPFSEIERQYTRTLLEYLEGIIDIDFFEVDRDAGQLGFGKHNMESGGYADYPGIGEQGVWLSSGATTEILGDYGFGSITHELGHALGLSHPNSYNGFSESGNLSQELDTSFLTIMTYNAGYARQDGKQGFAYGFSHLDIEALLNIYGPSTKSADNTFSVTLTPEVGSSSLDKSIPYFVPFVVADIHGYDTIDASALSNLQNGAQITFNFDKGLFVSTDKSYSIFDHTLGEWVSIHAADAIPNIGIHHDTVIESYVGTDHAETVLGNERPQSISAGYGDDLMTGLGGDDTLNGGSGIDTAVYRGSQSNYTLVLSPTTTTLTDRRPGEDGIDTLTDVEHLDFAQGIVDHFDLNIFGGTSSLSSTNFKTFIELYIAYFNRAPDAIGLNFWGTAFANGMSLDEIAAKFAPQPETVATYPEGTSNTEFVTTVYNNILGRGPDQGGLDFWVNGLEEGGLTRDTFILKLLGGVQDGYSDRAYLDNKVDIGAYFAVHKGMSDAENARAVMDLFGDQDVSNASGAKAAIDDYYAEALDPINGEFLLQVTGVLDNPFDIV